MSTIKKLLKEDVTSARTQLHEQIPVTGSLISGTYGAETDVRGLNSCGKPRAFTSGKLRSNLAEWHRVTIQIQQNSTTVTRTTRDYSGL